MLRACGWDAWAPAAATTLPQHALDFGVESVCASPCCLVRSGHATGCLVQCAERMVTHASRCGIPVSTALTDQLELIGE